jgi:hypothetical protein
MADNKNKGLGLPQTRGSFNLQGIVTGTEKDKFYTETTTKVTQKPFRMLNFGVKTDKDTAIYLNLNGGEQDKVYFSKTTTDENKKKTTTVEEVAWKDRFKFNKDKFKMIGVNVGVTKTTDDKGKEVNDKKVLTPYDACKEIYDHLKDDQSIFVRGTVEYSHFENNNGDVKRSVKFIPSQVSLCKNIDFEAEGFVPTAFFTQTIVFTEIKKDETNKEQDRFIVSAKIIGFNSVEDAEFIILDKNLANNFRKGLKPYNAITVSGIINMSKDTEEVETEDYWGEKNKMEKINSPMVRELIITGADPKTIDKDTYSGKAIEEAIAKVNANKKANKDFGNNEENWGSVGGSNTTEDDDSAW